MARNAKLFECVPNFSEGRVKSTIDRISQAIAETSGVNLLDVDIGESANRTVMTFVGGADDIVEAAFQAMATAADLIDMRLQKGSHPRIGATDVCPFVPLMEANMADCVQLSEQLASRVAAELKIPVYLYAASARSQEKRKLSFIRRGQYEMLAQRISIEGFLPDYDSSQFNEKSGASIIGARNLLIAYNISLDSQSVSQAERIAAKIRQMRINGDENLTDCTAIGWYTEEYNCAQVSMNLMDIRTASLHQAFNTVEKIAAEGGVKVTESEVIGLVPLRAILETGRFYERSKQQNANYDEKELIDLAVHSLRLRQSQKQLFDPEKKIIEYQLKNLGYGLNKDGFAA